MDLSNWIPLALPPKGPHPRIMMICPTTGQSLRASFEKNHTKLAFLHTRPTRQRSLDHKIVPFGSVLSLTYAKDTPLEALFQGFLHSLNTAIGPASLPQERVILHLFQRYMTRHHKPLAWMRLGTSSISFSDGSTVEDGGLFKTLAHGLRTITSQGLAAKTVFHLPQETTILSSHDRLDLEHRLQAFWPMLPASLQSQF